MQKMPDFFLGQDLKTLCVKKLIKMRAKKLNELMIAFEAWRKYLKLWQVMNQGAARTHPLLSSPSKAWLPSEIVHVFIHKNKTFPLTEFLQTCSNYMLRLLAYRIYSRISQLAYKSNWKNIWPKMTKIPKIENFLYSI